MRLFNTLLFTLLLAFSFSSKATLITTDLTSNDYITFNGLDWAWASPVNQQFWSDNELKLPGFHAGWRFATDVELAILKNDIDPLLFKRADGSYIQAVQYWNTKFIHVDPSNLLNKQISSVWLGGNNGYYETFYVRNSQSQTQPVPEPSTLLVFGLGLIALSLRLRKRY